MAGHAWVVSGGREISRDLVARFHLEYINTFIEAYGEMRCLTPERESANNETAEEKNQ